MRHQNKTDESYEELNLGLAKKFPKIVEHGETTGSYNYYINSQMEQALADNAPSNAIYKKDDSWITA